MSVLHLLWIIPVSAWLGFLLAAVLAASKRADPAETEPDPEPATDGGDTEV